MYGFYESALDAVKLSYQMQLNRKDAQIVDLSAQVEVLKWRMRLKDMGAVSKELEGG